MSYLSVPKNPYENDFKYETHNQDNQEGSFKLNESDDDSKSIKKRKNSRLKRDKELRKKSNRYVDIFSNTDLFSDDYSTVTSRKRTFRKSYKKWMLYPEDSFKSKWDLFITL